MADDNQLNENTEGWSCTDCGADLSEVIEEELDESSDSSVQSNITTKSSYSGSKVNTFNKDEKIIAI